MNNRHKAHRKARKEVSNYVNDLLLQSSIEKRIAQRGIDFDKEFTVWNTKTNSTTHIRTGKVFHHTFSETEVDEAVNWVLDN